MNRISIITRTLDRPLMLERALRSMLEQTFQDWQCVVVDSGSSGSVERLAAKYKAELGGRLLHLPFVNPKPGMRGIPINAGIKASQSEFITILDDDDTWAPDFLAKMVKALDQRPHPQVRGAVSLTRVLEESSVQSGLKPLREYELNPELNNVTLAHLAMVNRFCVHAFVYDRAALESVGLYPEDYPVLEDWHFNLRFLLHHDIVVVREFLSNYHIRPQETAGLAANSQTAELNDHKYHEARLINDAMREDLRTGKAGLGHVLSQAVMARQLADTMHKQESRLKAIGEKTGKIDTRTKELKDKFVPKR
jgi:glycosyltransferase involved in cell wall biosynthesis